MRALVIGHFSTVGDIEVLRHVERRLDEIEMLYDVGPFSTRLSALMPGSVNIYAVDPSVYTHMFVVCGPFDRNFLARRGADLDRFAHCVRIGVNLSMIERLEDYDPFDVLIGRDSNHWAKPDLSFSENVDRLKVAGLCIVSEQSEYGSRQRHQDAERMLRDLAKRANLAVVELDTHWPARNNRTGVNSPEEFESICSRLDVMLTNRLHGLVLALKNGVPAVALDAISGGGKVTRQANTIGWQPVVSIDDADSRTLDRALAKCLDQGAPARAIEVANRARDALSDFPQHLAQAMSHPALGKPTHTAATKISRRLTNAAARLIHRTRS